MGEHNKLRGRIVEKFGSVSEFSRQIGTSQQNASLKINGKVGFSKDDIISWSSELDIAKEDCYAFFID